MGYQLVHQKETVISLGFNLSDAKDLLGKKYAEREKIAKEEFEKRNIERKSGYYQWRGKEIDVVYSENEKRWFWGWMSSCGNHMDYQMWAEAKFIRPFEVRE